MKVLLIHNRYQQPGGERVAVEAQATLLREQGQDLVCYTRDNTEIQRYGLWQKAGFFGETFFSLKAWREIRSLVESERPDIAHVHNVFPLISPSAYRALKASGVPIVQTVHNFRFLCPAGIFYTQDRICERCKYGNTLAAVRWRCYRKNYCLSAEYAATIALHRRWNTFRLIDRYLALTEFAAKKLVESGLTTWDRVSVLGHFLPNPLPVPGSFESREPFLVYLGRLTAEKGVSTLLEAMSELPDLRLKVMGDGPQAGTLRAMARNMGLDHVEFLGRVAGDEKWKLLQQAMAVVVPSMCYEQFGFVVLESLAVGTPVVASNLGSLPYIVEDGRSGVLFPPGDSRQLRQRLAWLASHPEATLTMGRYARQLVETKYSSDTHYKQLMAIYAEVKH
jgi:glycosyltransferase involved in cell wall biosynthesis